MEVVKLIQPHEFGDNFILEGGKWKVKFPPIARSGVEVSKDVNNLVTLGTDGGMFVDATRIHAYALVQDNENMKIRLYRYQANAEFDIATATLINSIDMLELNGQFDDITITDAVVTFRDVQTDTELEFDTEQFLNVSNLATDDSMILQEVDNSTTKQVSVRGRDYDNLIQNTPEGLLVLPLDGVHIDHTLEARYKEDVPDEIEVDEFVRTINGNEIRMPAVTLKNLRGKTLGAIVAPISEKLPIPTTDRITIDTNTSVLDSRVLINGVDKGSFVDLSLNQIPELQFTPIRDSGYGSYGGDGYIGSGYEVDPYNEGSYSGDGYSGGYGSYGGDGYTIETEGYQFIVRNNTRKRLRVTIDGFNAINLTAHSDGINSLAVGRNKIGFDLAPRFVDEVSVYFAFCNEDGVALSMAERDVLHEGGTTLRLEATYLDSGSFSPPIEVTVDGESYTLTAEEGSRTAFYTITLPVIDDHLNQYYWPEIKVKALAGTPIDYNINPYPVAVRSLIPMPDIVVSSSGVTTPYGCEETAWNGTLNYVYRPKVESEKAIVSSGGTFGFTIAPRFANMNVFYDADDVLPEEQLIGKLDSSGGINFTIKELIPREDDDAIIGIRDVDIHANYYINISVRRM